MGLKAVPVNVTGEPELQLITWLGGFTELVGAVVLMVIAIVLVAVHPVAGSKAVTVIVFGCVTVTELAPEVKVRLVQL